MMYVKFLFFYCCKSANIAQGEYRQNACYGVHTELYGDDFWTNCRNVGSQDRG